MASVPVDPVLESMANSSSSRARVLDEDEDGVIQPSAKKPRKEPAKKKAKATKATPIPKATKATPISAPVDPKSDDEEDEKSKSTRGPKYTEDEDVQLCRSWLEITEDPLNSTNQTADTFWTRVEEHFSKHLCDPPQSFNSLKSRWQAVQRAINKFHGCFKQVQQANQSGASNDDQLSTALKLYAATEKRSFPHLRCYHVLSNAPKWNSYSTDLQQNRLIQSKKPQTPSDTDAQSVNLSSDVTHSDAMSDATATPSLGRPTGNKRAKEIKQEEAQDKKWKEDMLKVQRSLVEKSTAQSKILSDQKNAMVDVAEETIMSVDLSSISESRRPYYEWKQKKILDKIQKEQEDEKRKEKEEEEKKKG
ncbi:hypothetical protein PGT21_050359 [Puccinia graminis f. sp. tritici]|uniref:No apical meristem-associated C-terminal domain-containing protein n=1 Tax=Puccinia graminis f. sp. tritici TaxID=56615 RepID=A0A5B0PSA1_PUCGR|nr:hypothetical protein PGT21_050359 [Puccinia graminis f. sp. tritici]